MERRLTKSLPTNSNVPLRRLGQVELIAAGGAFIAPAFSLAAIFAAIALTGGAVAPFGVVLGTLAALLAAGCFAAMSRRFPRAGGAYALVGAVLPRPLSFLAGWSLALLYLLGPAIPLALVAGGLGFFFPALAPYFFLLAVGISVLVFAINASGVRPSTRVALLLFVGEIAVLLGIALLLFSHTSAPAPSSTGAVGVLHALGGSAAAAVFLYLGFDSVSTYGEEAHLPRKQIAVGTLAALGLTAVVYVVCSLAFLYAIPSSVFASNPSLSDAVTGVLGPAGGDLIAAVIVISSMGALIAVENACSRSLFAMGRDGVLPVPLARLMGREKTPRPALAFSAAISVVLVGWSLVSQGPLAAPRGFLSSILPGMLVFGALVAYGLVSVAYLVTLGREGALRRHPLRCLLPAGAAVVSGVLLVLQVLPGTPGSSQVLWGAGVWLVIGFSLWGATRALRPAAVTQLQPA